MKGLRIQLFFCVFGLSVGCESSSIPDRGLVVEPRRVALDCAQLDPCEATVTLTNVTEDIVSGAWALLSEQGPGFSLVQGDQSFRMLGAGESEVSRRTFTVRLDPQADVERAVVRVSYERAGVAQPPIDVPVTRRDIGDAVLEVASQLRLPGGRPGERITAELELRNAGIGNVALFVREVQVDDPQVEVSFAEALPVRIGVGESVRATVAWTPLSATFLETKIRINPNDVSFVRRAVVDLVGTTLEGAIIGTEQAQVDFGDMGVGEEVQRNLTVRNRGTTPATVDVNIEGDGRGVLFSVEPSQIAVPPLESRVLSLSARAFETGLYTSTVALQARGAVDAVRVPLRAQVCGPQVDVQPSVLDFGNVVAGFISTGTITVSNTGFCPLELSDIRFQESPGFWLDRRPSRGTLIEAGRSEAIRVNFRPEQQGSLFTTVMDIQTRDPRDFDSARTLGVRIEGRGVTCEQGCQRPNSEPQCVDGACSFTCIDSAYDLDGAAANGCECTELPGLVDSGQTCATKTESPIELEDNSGGGLRVFEGVVAPAAEEDWYFVHVHDDGAQVVTGDCFFGSSDRWRVTVGFITADPTIRWCVTRIIRNTSNRGNCTGVGGETVRVWCSDDTTPVDGTAIFDCGDADPTTSCLVLTRNESCDFNDSSDLLVRVDRIGSSPTCEPYRLNVSMP